MGTIGPFHYAVSVGTRVLMNWSLRTSTVLNHTSLLARQRIVMARTPEEIAANEAIEKAIEGYRDAYRIAHPDATFGTLVDWVVVAAEIKPNMEDAAEDVTAYSIIMPGGAIPWYRARGLLEAGIY